MLKPVSRRQLIKRLRELRFHGPYIGTKHGFMVRQTLKLRIPNPHEGDIGVPLLREILRQAGIDPKHW